MRVCLVEDGAHVELGEQLTVELSTPRRCFASMAVGRCSGTSSTRSRRCIAQQGVSIHDKHIEVIVRQMLRGSRSSIWDRFPCW